MFPSDNAWNRRIDGLPVAAGSAATVGAIGATKTMHADFGAGLWDGGPIGIPITVVGKGQAKSAVRFEYADESDRGPYPIPAGVKIEGGAGSDGDRHALIVDRDACKLYELYALRRVGGRWTAGSGAIWNLRSNRVRPAGWTSADAAGLSILPGLARYDEVASGRIDHALRFTVSRTRRAYVWPARHYASSLTDPALPAMGARLRLKSSFDTSGFPRQARVVLEALKRYGMIVADNGSDWYVSGAPDPRWSNDDLHTLGRVPGSAFEVVDTSSLAPLASLRLRKPRRAADTEEMRFLAAAIALPVLLIGWRRFRATRAPACRLHLDKAARERRAPWTTRRFTSASRSSSTRSTSCGSARPRATPTRRRGSVSPRSRCHSTRRWDLLRQREALRSANMDPDVAVERDPSVVENYRQ